MEKLQRSKSIIELGKMLVSEFDLTNSTDTLGRWMSHYLSELLIDAQSAEGDLKIVAEDRCFNAILQLWEHVNDFPKAMRPMESIDPFIRTLKAINPENEKPFYHAEYFADIEDKNSPSLPNLWLNLAKEIDCSARILIEMCLRSSANEIIEEEKEYFAMSDMLEIDKPNMKIIRFVLQDSEVSDVDEKKTDMKERIERLESRKSHLERMILLSETMKQEIEEELINLRVK